MEGFEIGTLNDQAMLIKSKFIGGKEHEEGKIP